MLNIGKFCGLYNTRAHNIIYYCNLNITIILINVHNRPLISIETNYFPKETTYI